MSSTAARPRPPRSVRVPWHRVLRNPGTPVLGQDYYRSADAALAHVDVASGRLRRRFGGVLRGFPERHSKRVAVAGIPHPLVAVQGQREAMSV
jgi:hypothetical protein